MVAGWEMSVSTPPRLSPSEQSRTRAEDLLGGLQAAEVERDRARRSPSPGACGPRGRGGRGSPASSTRSTFLWLQQEAARPGRRSPRGAACARASVFVPRSTSQESNGDRIAPAAFWTYCSHSACFACFTHRDAADAVRVPVQELRRGVDHDVGPERERLLEEGAHEGVVDDQDRAPLARDLGERPRCRRSSSAGWWASRSTACRSGPPRRRTPRRRSRRGTRTRRRIGRGSW